MKETREEYLWRLRTTASRTRVARKASKQGIYYELFDYHLKVRNAILDRIFACSLGQGEYAEMSREERKKERKRLEDLEEEHHQKARMYGYKSGYILC